MCLSLTKTGKPYTRYLNTLTLCGTVNIYKRCENVIVAVADMDGVRQSGFMICMAQHLTHCTNIRACALRTTFNTHAYG